MSEDPSILIGLMLLATALTCLGLFVALSPSL